MIRVRDPGAAPGRAASAIDRADQTGGQLPEGPPGQGGCPVRQLFRACSPERRPRLPNDPILHPNDRENNPVHFVARRLRPVGSNSPAGPGNSAAIRHSEPPPVPRRPTPAPLPRAVSLEGPLRPATNAPAASPAAAPAHASLRSGQAPQPAIPARQATSRPRRGRQSRVRHPAQRPTRVPTPGVAAAASEEIRPAGHDRFPEGGSARRSWRFMPSWSTAPSCARPACPTPQINLTTQTALTKKEAIQALDVVLGMNGIAMVNVGDKFVKAVPTANAGGSGQETFKGTGELLPELGQYVTYVMQVTNVRPSDLVQALQPFASSPVPQPDSADWRQPDPGPARFQRERQAHGRDGQED